MPITRFLILLCLLLVTASCDKSSENPADLSNKELRKKWRECAYIDDPSSSEQQQCENYENECQKRKNQNNLSCY